MQSSDEQHQMEGEAKRFSSYLIGVTPDDVVVARYVEAILPGLDRAQISKRDERLLVLTTRFPWLIGSIDGGLALLDPTSEVRRRILVMFALLEANPAYTRYFLPRKRSPFYAVVVLLLGIRASYRALLGIAIVKVVS